MSFIVKGGGGGPTNWSDIIIDADKDMLGFGMSNMKQVVAAMIGGDLIAKGLAGVLIRIPAGIANTVLTSAGVGLVPTWAPGGLYLNRYFPVNINITNTATKNPTINYTKTVASSPISSVHVDELGDDIANMVSMTSPAITVPDAQTLNFAPDYSEPVAASAVHSHHDLIQVLEGAVAEDGGVPHDETVEAKNATANDMTLLPAAPADDDAYYFGSTYMFDELILNIGTAGNGVWSVAWEYYHSDTTWHALADLVDGTNGFQAAAGNRSVTFTKDAANWTAIDAGAGSMYYIRMRIDVYTSIVAHPHGTQAWYKIIL